MATADISEFVNLARDANGNIILAGMEPSIVDQQITIGSATQSAAFKGNYVRIHVDAACRILFGANPTASSTSKRLAAGATEYFGVVPGHKVSIITSA